MQVDVPASCANLGPGFDALAVAVDLRLVATITDRSDARVVSHGEGAGELPTGDDNLVWRALTAYCAWAGVAVPDVSVAVDNPIPLERGLGSSAAAAAAGVTLGRALTGGGGTDAELVALVAQFEGHADNAAAAILGGLCVAVSGAAPRRLEPTAALRPVLCVPQSRQSTAEARGLLPQQVPLSEAAANGARTALVVAGLVGAIVWEPSAMRDVLHEPARLAAMPASRALVERLRADGLGACLSGAGPAVLAVLPEKATTEADRIRADLGDDWDVRMLRWNLGGAVVRAIRPPG